MDDKTNKRNKLAADILRLSRNTLLVNLRFMDLALNQLHPDAFEQLRFASDGETLFYDPLWVLKSYKNEQNAKRSGESWLPLMIYTGKSRLESRTMKSSNSSTASADGTGLA